jgi:hypothetical protein
MQNCDPPAIDLDATTLVAIAAAAKPDKPLSDETLEVLRGWLADALAGAVKDVARRTQGTPLTKGEIRQLEKAHFRFKYFVDAFQNRDDPPPLLPVMDNELDPWEWWIAGVTAFGFGPGRPPETDWSLIARLLAIYETISGRECQPNTIKEGAMPFLALALKAMARNAPPEMREHFARPKQSALSKQLFHPPECNKKCPNHCNGIGKLRPGISNLKLALVSPAG